MAITRAVMARSRAKSEVSILQQDGCDELEEGAGIEVARWVVVEELVKMNDNE